MSVVSVPIGRGDRLGRPSSLNAVPLCAPNGQKFGVLKKDWSRDGLGLHEICYQPDLRMSRHSHDLSRFILVVDGSVTHRLESEQRCGAGSTVSVPRCEMHEDIVGGSGARCFIVELGCPWLAKHAVADLPVDRLGFAGLTGPFSGLMIRLRRECRVTDSASDIIVDGLVLEMIGQVRRASSSSSKIPPGWLVSIRDLLHDRFRDPHTIGDLAAEAGVHPVHLCREFRRHTGLTVGSYLRRLRIDYACSELSRTGRKVTEIALDAGFSSHAHFASAFRCIVGMPPSNFRDRARPR
jgi:AraC family transcriptional regulator